LCAWTWPTPRAGAFARAGKFSTTRTAARLQTPRGTTLTWEDGASRIRPPSDSKSPRPVSRRGLQLFCDDGDMPVICPTCQTLKLSVAKFYSNPCTGGALLPAASAGLAIGSGAPAAGASSRAAALACLARRPFERAAECLTPQECAIAGPAVYPIKAPATAPTGPSTTAPETAPKAALPARSCAIASTENSDAAITAITSSFFIAVPCASAPMGPHSENAAAQR
jgi:hypothetical protein